MHRRVTLEDVTEALKRELGDKYKVTPTRIDDKEKVRVSHAMEVATVHLVTNGDPTTVKVRGGGFIISRIANEFGFSHRVCKAIGDTVG